MNRTNFLAGNAMRLKGNTKNRPEQLLIEEIIQFHSKIPVQTILEKKIVYDREDGTTREAIPDILVMEANKPPLIIRVMGPYHDSQRQQRKDEIQLEYLQLNQYRVVDMWYWKMPNTFKRNKRKLTEFELIAAHAEVLTALYKIIEITEPLDLWLENSKHIKTKEDN